MKKGWLAVGLLAAMVALSLWHVSALGGLTGDLGEQLRRAEKLAEQGGLGQGGGAHPGCVGAVGRQGLLPPRHPGS